MGCGVHGLRCPATPRPATGPPRFVGDAAGVGQRTCGTSSPASPRALFRPFAAPRRSTPPHTPLLHPHALTCCSGLCTAVSLLGPGLGFLPRGSNASFAYLVAAAPLPRLRVPTPVADCTTPIRRPFHCMCLACAFWGFAPFFTLAGHGWASPQLRPPAGSPFFASISPPFHSPQRRPAPPQAFHPCVHVCVHACMRACMRACECVSVFAPCSTRWLVLACSCGCVPLV